jgi:hypothetical protein
MCVDGKVLLATEGGDLFIFRHDPRPDVIDGVEAAKGATNMREARVIHKATRAEVAKKYLEAQIELPAPIRTTPPTVVNGVLFLATENTLIAIGRK